MKNSFGTVTVVICLLHDKVLSDNYLPVHYKRFLTDYSNIFLFVHPAPSLWVILQLKNSILNVSMDNRGKVLRQRDLEHMT